MKNSFRIARILGIDIGIDASWLIIFFLLVFEFGFLQFPRELHPFARRVPADPISISLGVAASLLLFGSVLAHELSHSWMAIKRGIPVLSITLFIFGGVARIADEPDHPATEFLIAIMGPLMSAALAAVFGAAWIWLRIIDSDRLLNFSFAPAIALLGILWQSNLALALFNLAPGFPLDGGRVLRAALWGWWHDVRAATLWASRSGQVIAVMMVAYGGWQLLQDGNWGGVWFALIALFLWNAAREGYRQTNVRESLRSVHVGQLMLSDVQTVSPELGLGEFVAQFLVHRRDPAFAVADSTGILGLISIDHVRRIPRAEWQTLRVREAMTPIGRLAALRPNDNAASALAQLSRSDDPELPVMEQGQLVGVLSEAELSRYLRLNS